MHARVGVAKNLLTYQLKPKEKNGTELFAHMIGYCERNNNSTNGSKYTTSGSPFWLSGSNSVKFRALPASNW